MSKSLVNEKLTNFNRIQNDRIEIMTRAFIQFIETNIKVSVKQVVTKFIIDLNKKIYFIGAGEMKCTPKQESMKKLIRGKYLCGDGLVASFEEYFNLINNHDRESYGDPKENVRFFKKDNVKKCCGSFCGYTMMNTVEETFKVKEEMVKDFEKTEKVCIKIDHKSGERFFISKALLEKINRNVPVVNSILAHLGILAPSTAPKIPDLENLTIAQLTNRLDMAFDRETSDGKHVIFKYKNEPVCLKCYNILSILRKKFGSRINRDLLAPLSTEASSKAALSKITYGLNGLPIRGDDKAKIQSQTANDSLFPGIDASTKYSKG